MKTWHENNDSLAEIGCLLLFGLLSFRREYEPLNLSKLQLWIDSGRIDPDMPINMYTLHQAGIVSRHIKHGVKLLGGVCKYRKHQTS